jgi:hypothetical protein
LKEGTVYYTVKKVSDFPIFMGSLKLCPETSSILYVHEFGFRTLTVNGFGYIYLLSCIDEWGVISTKLCPEIEVNYKINMQ